jgi:hypothetical protein
MGRYVFGAILAEFGQALAAARSYESLRYGCANRDGLAHADIPRRIFEEFYARQGHVEQAPLASGLLHGRNDKRHPARDQQFPGGFGLERRAIATSAVVALFVGGMLIPSTWVSAQGREAPPVPNVGSFGVEAIGPRAAVVGVRHFQRIVSLTCSPQDNEVLCSGRLPAIQSKRRLRVRFVSCFIGVDEGSTFGTGTLSVRDGPTFFAVQLLTPSFINSRGHVVNQAADLLIAAGRRGNLNFSFGNSVGAGTAFCTVTGELEILL